MFFDYPIILSFKITPKIRLFLKIYSWPGENARPIPVDNKPQQMKMILIPICPPLYRTPGNRTESYSRMFPSTKANMDLYMPHITANFQVKLIWFLLLILKSKRAVGSGVNWYLVR